jgi:hypothetical protein
MLFRGSPPKDFMIAAVGDPSALLPSIRRIVAKADSVQPISDVQTLTELVEDETASRRTQLWVIGAFRDRRFPAGERGPSMGCSPLPLSQRGAEIGLRRAMGAQASDVAWMVFSEALLLGAGRSDDWAGGRLYSGAQHADIVGWRGGCGSSDDGRCAWRGDRHDGVWNAASGRSRGARGSGADATRRMSY